MKKIVLIFIILLFCGCEAQYNLNIDEKFTEDLTVLEDAIVVSSNAFKNLLELKKNGIQLYDDSHDSFYKMNIFEDGIEMGFVLNGTFNSTNSKSYIVHQACEKYKVVRNRNIIKIEASNFKIFKEHSDLDKIMVNIKSQYKISSSNADKIKGNVYTWVIDRDNYNSKEINITINLSNSSNTSMIKFSIAILVLVLLSFIFFIVVKIRHKKANDF